MRGLVGVLLFFLAFQGGEFHSYHLGACPNIEPMRDFDMNKMLGIWYVIEKTSTGSSCITYNFTRTEEPEEYRVEQVSQHLILGLTPLKHGYHYTGTLKTPDSAIPARMNVKFPLNVAGSSSFTVFMTDYATYAAVFTCQKLAFSHRQSTTILSRTRTLEKMYIEKIRSKMATSQIDPFELSIINQKDCPKDLSDAYNINIDDETFSAKSAAGVIKKAGEKLGDGVEYIAGKGSQLYHTVADKAEDNKERIQKQVSVNPDAEWLP